MVERLCRIYFNSKSPLSLREDIRKTFALLGAATACDDLVGGVLERLSADKVEVRNAAVSALGAMGEKVAREDVIAVFLDGLSDKKSSMRREAASALGPMGEKVAREEVITALLERLSDTKDDVRHAAAKAIPALSAKVQSHTKPAVIWKRTFWFWRKNSLTYTKYYGKETA